jgi:hypothetical protein
VPPESAADDSAPGHDPRFAHECLLYCLELNLIKICNTFHLIGPKCGVQTNSSCSRPATRPTVTVGQAWCSGHGVHHCGDTRAAALTSHWQPEGTRIATTTQLHTCRKQCSRRPRATAPRRPGCAGPGSSGCHVTESVTVTASGPGTAEQSVRRQLRGCPSHWQKPGGRPGRGRGRPVTVTGSLAP